MAIQQITADEAHQLLAKDHRYTDVRIEDEFAGGHQATAVNAVQGRRERDLPARKDCGVKRSCAVLRQHAK